MNEQIKKIYGDVKIGVVSLGCDKNRVDTEQMLGLLSDAGYIITNNPGDADVIIVNTCAFILPARKESIETIIEMAGYKDTGKCKKLVVTGCLSQHYSKDISDGLPEIDCIIGIGQYPNIVEIMDNLLIDNKRLINCNIGGENAGIKRILTTNKHYAYLKIADGCDNKCTYCMIPKIRGSYRSVPMESLITDAESVAQDGVEELILVAQDVTNYGVDLYGRFAIRNLVDKLSEIKGIERIRLLYCYPERIDDNFIEMLKTNDKVVKYLDVPMQHVSDRILKLMNRKSRYDELISLIEKLRAAVPNISLRSTFIIGFPSETEEDNDLLCEFLEKVKLNNAGFFEYSLEEETSSAKIKGRVKSSDIKRRLKKAATVQAAVCKERNKEKIGKTIDAIIDEDNGLQNGYYLYKGHTKENAPEIDAIINIIADKSHTIGEKVKVTVTDFDNYDLTGEIQ